VRDDPWRGVLLGQRRDRSRPRSSPQLTIPQARTQYVDAYGGALWNVQLAAATLSALPVPVIFVLAQRQFVEGLAQTALKG
jgi:multiple sugar transport system permease protein